MAETTRQAQPSGPARRWLDPATSAWLVVLTFFLLFCLIVAVSGVAGWRYYNDASIAQGGLLRVHVNPSSVAYQTRGSAQTSILERPYDPCPPSNEKIEKKNTDICKAIEDGTRIKTRPGSGYGPVASLKLFDSSQIDLWAHPVGVDLTLQTYQVTRWTKQRQVVTFQQNAGYARYDIARGQPYTQVEYTVEISNGVRIALEPGGSYSINLPNQAPDTQAAQADTSAPLLVEVSARSGSAKVQSGGRSTIVLPGKRLAVDTSGQMQAPVAAVWELIDDGSFDRYPKEKYDDLTDAWVIRSAAAAQGMKLAEQNGSFRAVKECPPQHPDICEPADQISAGQFRRDGNQTKPYITAIDQMLDADVSEYTKGLTLTATLRVLTQTVALAGVAGSECPIMITLTYKQISPTDPEQEDTTCIYAGDDDALVKAPYIRYFRVPFYRWYELSIPLRAEDSQLKKVRYLQQIRIYANGHDYASEITKVSLRGQP